MLSKSNNPRRSYCDLKVENSGAVCHLGFYRKLILKILQPSRTDLVPSCQITTQSRNERFSYWLFSKFPCRYVTLWPLVPWPWKVVVHQVSCDQTLYQMWARSNKRCLIVDRSCASRSTPSSADLPHQQRSIVLSSAMWMSSKFVRQQVEWIFTISQPPRRLVHQRVQFQHHRAMLGWVIVDSNNFPGSFFRSNFRSPYRRSRTFAGGIYSRGSRGVVLLCGLAY